MEELAFDVGPEFLEYLAYHVRPNVGDSPLVEAGFQIPLVRVISHHRQRSQGIADNLRRIERGDPVVVSGYDDTADRIAQTALFRAIALAEITRILMEKSGDKCFGEIIANQ